MSQGNIETRARTRDLEFISPSLNKVTSTESNLDICLAERRGQSKDKGAGGHFSIPEYSNKYRKQSPRVSEEYRDQSEDKRAEGHFSVPDTVASTESNLHMCLRKRETRARTCELQVTLP
jgi:hypothetical protein